jgi:oligopeptide/dipeptide ABC transporter ATP-binding protein
MVEPILELRSIQRDFRIGRHQTVRALQDISLEVIPNEILCLVGESGCGKTTTGKILAGLLRPSQGDVFFGGCAVSKLSGDEVLQFRRSVQIIHQDPYASLNPVHTIYSTLSFPLFRHKVTQNRTQARDAVAKLLETVDLTPVGDVIDKYPHQLSGGQRQRVSIARALTTSPKVIVADEAVSMVDVSIRIGLLNMLLKMKKELGLTLVFITHDLALAKHLAWEGRIAVMYLGRIVEVGPTQDITSNPQHPYTRILMSAIPEPDPELARTKKHIQLRSEDIPSLLHLPTGCAFHPRCPWYKENLCEQKIPSLEPPPGRGDQIRVACLRLQAGEVLG